MKKALERDLKKLQARAFCRAEWAEDVLRRYHAVTRAHLGTAPECAPSRAQQLMNDRQLSNIPCRKSSNVAVPEDGHTPGGAVSRCAPVTLKLGDRIALQLRALYEWMFVPPTLWPFNIQDALSDCLAALEKGKRLNSRHRLLIDLLPEPPDKTICAAVAEHELRVQKGTYENVVKTQAKYSQTQLATSTDPELRRQWSRIKAAFDVQAHRDHKGVIRRTMNTERNLRPAFAVNLRRREDVFRAAFDAFCLRWNLYGMQKDEPLLLKLTVNITPYGTMIHIPAYWSFDPKRDIQWDAIARLHRTRVPRRQGSALAEGVAERMRAAEKLRRLDQEVHRLGLKGEKKHEFLCAGLGWVPGTSAKRISRLRGEFASKWAE